MAGSKPVVKSAASNFLNPVVTPKDCGPNGKEIDGLFCNPAKINGRVVKTFSIVGTDSGNEKGDPRQIRLWNNGYYKVFINFANASIRDLYLHGSALGPLVGRQGVSIYVPGQETTKPLTSLLWGKLPTLRQKAIAAGIAAQKVKVLDKRVVETVPPKGFSPVDLPVSSLPTSAGPVDGGTLPDQASSSPSQVTPTRNGVIASPVDAGVPQGSPRKDDLDNLIDR